MTRNKLRSVAVSVFVAFSLWLFVVNNVVQEDDMTFYDIPVVAEGEAVLNEGNLMTTGYSAKTVSVTISGKRSDLNKLSNGHLTAKVNLSRIEEPGENIPLSYTLSYPDNVSANDFTELSKNPAYIYVDVDHRRTKEVPVKLKWTGTRAEDYIYDTENAVLDYSAITVVGPAAVADLVDHVLVEIDLTEQVKSISDSFRYTLCDAEGNAVMDADWVKTDVEEIRVDLPIQRIREVTLTADVIYGGGANAENTTVTIEPASIRLSGSDAILEELGDTLTVATLNLASVDRSQDLMYTLNLPEGVINQTGVSEVKVTVKFKGLITREFTLSTFQAANLPEGMMAEIINATLTVKVRGPAEEINRLTAEDITAVVDFSAAEVGTATYKATIVFGDDFPNAGALGTSSVSATVELAQEE